MPKIDYNKTVIYKISCKTPSVSFVHVSSTTNFSKRKFDHKRNSDMGSILPLYETINNQGGWENWEMKIIEQYPCDTRNEATSREKYWLRQLHHQIKHATKHICDTCNREFTRRDALTRHVKTCKETKAELEQCKKIIAEQQCQLAQRQPENKKVSVKNSNNTNNIINTTNNITYRVELGNENLQSRLTEREKKRILEKMHSSLIEYIKLVHFSEKYPDCMNFFCTNLRSNHAHVYSEPQKQFITKYASDFFNTVIDTRLDEIITMFDEHKDKLEEIKIERLNKFFESMESTDECKSKRYMETVADVKMLAYNNKHKFEGQSQEPSVLLTSSNTTTAAAAATTTATATTTTTTATPLVF